MIVVVAPGQGSQTPGFLQPWLAVPGVPEHLSRLGEAAELDLIAHGTVSTADTLRDTAIAQPLIVAAGLVALAALRRAGGREIGGIAGHSVGEITAAAGAGILSESDAMRFVAARGRAMAAAAAEVETGMSAVIGGDVAEVQERLAKLNLSPANYNGAGQLVAAGPIPALAELRNSPPTGSRVIPLQVAGAFHTPYMASAQTELAALAATLAVTDPALPIWTNRDGSSVSAGRVFLDLLVGQVASPVRWDRTMAALAASGVRGIIELPPAGALTGLLKRSLKGTPSVALKTPSDLAAALLLLQENQ